jgi:hypothetical protein
MITALAGGADVEVEAGVEVCSAQEIVKPITSDVIIKATSRTNDFLTFFLSFPSGSTA